MSLHNYNPTPAVKSNLLGLLITCATTDVSWCRAESHGLVSCRSQSMQPIFMNACREFCMGLRIHSREAKPTCAKQDHLLLEAIVLFHSLSDGNAQSIHSLLQCQSLRIELPCTIGTCIPATLRPSLSRYECTSAPGMAPDHHHQGQLFLLYVLHRDLSHPCI